MISPNQADYNFLNQQIKQDIWIYDENNYRFTTSRPLTDKEYKIYQDLFHNLADRTKSEEPISLSVREVKNIRRSFQPDEEERKEVSPKLPEPTETETKEREEKRKFDVWEID